MKAIKSAFRAFGAVTLIGAAFTTADGQWLHGAVQGAAGAYAIWSTTAHSDRVFDIVFLFTRRHHRSCLRAHPGMTHDRYVTEFLPFYAATLTAKREQEGAA